jgi:hypothetical protein
MRRGQILLEMLLLALAAHGLGPTALDPWRGWVVFKEFARAAAEAPDPGVSVQVTRFVDLVEESPSFQDLIVTPPLTSAVYWLEA